MVKKNYSFRCGIYLFSIQRHDEEELFVSMSNLFIFYSTTWWRRIIRFDVKFIYFLFNHMAKENYLVQDLFIYLLFNDTIWWRRIIRFDVKFIYFLFNDMVKKNYSFRCQIYLFSIQPHGEKELSGLTLIYLFVIQRHGEEGLSGSRLIYLFPIQWHSEEELFASMSKSFIFYSMTCGKRFCLCEYDFFCMWNWSWIYIC
jgi:hypothetical protein